MQNVANVPTVQRRKTLAKESEPCLNHSVTPVDLTTTYLGLPLKNPLVASASPLSKKLDLVQRLEDAGAAAVVLYSLFEEQITHESHELDHYLTRGTDTYAEALSYFPDLEHYNIGPEPYLEHLHRVKQAVDIPVIGSLNGVSTGGWVEYAQRIEQAGADALELNIYYLPTDPRRDAAPSWRTSYLALVARCAGARAHPGRGQAQPVLHLAAEHGPRASRDAGARRAGAVQPLLPARLRPGAAGGGAEPDV